MIWNGSGVLKLEEGEPAFRSCWECNPAHERLKRVNMLHACPWCGRHWVFDRYFESFQSEEEFDEFFRSKGMKPGDSTSKVAVGEGKEA